MALRFLQLFEVCKRGKNRKNGCNSVTIGPIRLRFWLKVVTSILLLPYEVTLLAKSSPSTRKRGVQHEWQLFIREILKDRIGETSMQ